VVVLRPKQPGLEIRQNIVFKVYQIQVSCLLLLFKCFFSVVFL
jgi:hypothetical protein